MNRYFDRQIGTGIRQPNPNDLQPQQTDPTDPPKGEPPTPRIPYPEEATTRSLRWKWYNIQERVRNGEMVDPMEYEADEEVLYNRLKAAESKGTWTLRNYKYPMGQEGTDSYILDKELYRVAQKYKDDFSPKYYQELMKNYSPEAVKKLNEKEAFRNLQNENPYGGY